MCVGGGGRPSKTLEETRLVQLEEGKEAMVSSPRPNGLPLNLLPAELDTMQPKCPPGKEGTCLTRALEPQGLPGLSCGKSPTNCPPSCHAHAQYTAVLSGVPVTLFETSDLTLSRLKKS